jgi:hypothetical protein
MCAGTALATFVIARALTGRNTYFLAAVIISR